MVVSRDKRDAEGMVQQMLAALPEDLARWGSLCAGVKDWGAIFDRAGKHGVAAVLYHYLTQLAIALPPEVETGVKQQLTAEWLAQLRMRAALEEALQALEAGGVRAVNLKGPVLAERLYEEPSLRPCSDIDFLVALADLDRATAALEAIGYQGPEWLLARYDRENTHHTHLYRADAPPLELHFRAITAFGAIVPAEELLSRAMLYRTAAGRDVWVLSPEDEAFYLALHATRHLFLNVFWLYDLKLFLRRYPDLDWPLIAERARSLRVMGALSLAWEALDRQLGVAVPERRYFRPRHKLLAGLARLTLAATARQPPGSGRETAGRMLFRALLCDHPASSAWSFRHRLLRFARRRAQRYLPWLVPEKWSA
ncbi:MAG: nucleotidyltransferase family protein [Acidobacteria bacterium]|nr:nucleotidyltransferase family protein [Acidobacteriota bacterium]